MRSLTHTHTHTLSLSLSLESDVTTSDSPFLLELWDEVEKVSLLNFDVVDAELLAVPRAPLDLVVVDGDTGNVGAAVSGNGSNGAANAATDVEGLQAGSEAENVRDASLVRDLRLRDALALERWREVEALPPAPLVNVRHEVVKGVHGVLGVILVLNALALALRNGER